MRRAQLKTFYKKIAKERIEILLDLAFKKLEEGDEELAKKYMQLVRTIALKTNYRLKGLKKYFCKKCFIPLVIGKTARVRLNKNHKTINITCLKCGYVKRYPYKPKKLSWRPHKSSSS
ncbi:MAG: hypothetical protein QXT38_02250 [Candidatus Aenigmatarchaeota archaeon]